MGEDIGNDCPCCNPNECAECCTGAVTACNFVVYVLSCTIISQHACATLCGIGKAPDEKKLGVAQQNAALVGEKVGEVGGVEIRMAVAPIVIRR